MTKTEHTLKIVNDHAGSSLWLEHVLNPEYQKLFPFHYFQNFKIRQGERPCCDYCGESFNNAGNGMYFTAYIVWESADDIRLCCSIRNCRKHKGILYDFHEQKFGNPEPIVLPDHLAQCEMYFAVFQVFCKMYKSTPYRLVNYLDTGLDKAAFKDVIDSNYRGGSVHWEGWQKKYDCESYQWDGRHFYVGQLCIPSERESNKRILISAAKVRQVINDILKANTGKAQLSLF